MFRFAPGFNGDYQSVSLKICISGECDQIDTAINMPSAETGMNQINKIKKLLLAAVIITGTSVCSLAYPQSNNPNKLPPCPKPDYLKKSDVGMEGRTEKWTNCWGRYKVEFSKTSKGDVLEGEWLNGVLHGQATYNYANGDKYVGAFKDGSSHGQGTHTHASGAKYVGEWKNDKQDGHGTFISATGDKYVGEFKQGTFNGQGTYIHASGEKYVGEWKNDKQNGYGTFTSVSGDKYAGDFVDGKYDGRGTHTFVSGDKYVGDFKDGAYFGQGTYIHASGEKYIGEWKNDKENGYGTFTFTDGDKYVGEFKDGEFHGQGVRTGADGTRFEGIWEKSNFIREAKVNPPSNTNNVTTNKDRTDIDRERQQLAEERRRLEEEKRQRERAKASQQINLQVTNTQPNSIDGSFFIEIKTNADTASLQIDGKEEGGKADGSYIIKRIARAGQASSFKIIATDVYGNTDAKTISVTRSVVESNPTYAALNPGQVKQQTTRDAVAIIIGIADYKSLPKADFANDDARVFYDYAIRALGVKPENIKLLVDSDADQVEILRTFRNWLPSKVRSTTEVYVFYSGHGLPTADGQSLYLIPPRAAKDLIDDTAIPFSKINAAILSAKPKSVTMILDACYSGQARSGETLVANARPVTLKTESRLFPETFTVITASQNDQISSSNPDLQHGIFSYYLMKGMEGDADANKDGKITLGEMQTYLVENVGRQAGMMNRKQEPQLVGDANRVLVGR